MSLLFRLFPNCSAQTQGFGGPGLYFASRGTSHLYSGQRQHQRQWGTFQTQKTQTKSSEGNPLSPLRKPAPPSAPSSSSDNFTSKLSLLHLQTYISTTSVWVSQWRCCHFWQNNSLSREIWHPFRKFSSLVSTHCVSPPGLVTTQNVP